MHDALPVAIQWYEQNGKSAKVKTNRVIQALADGFKDGGCKLSANYPGFHSDELHDEMGGGVTSVNEKTAYAFAWGACLAGARSVVSMKNVGLSDAADANAYSMRR